MFAFPAHCHTARPVHDPYGARISTASARPHPACRARAPLLLVLALQVGDSKRAMDEYTSEIFMGGKNTLVIHNTCEDSLLAAPIILDLVLLAELLTRIEVCGCQSWSREREGGEAGGAGREGDLLLVRWEAVGAGAREGG